MKRSMIAVFVLVLGALTATVRAAEYQIDPVHTSLIYRIKHLNASWSYGRFNGTTGTFSYDPSAPEKASFEISVDVNNIDSGNEKRDTHLKSPDFFNLKQYPTIHFKSTSVKKSDQEGNLEVTGDLTLHGVTKPVTITLTHVGIGRGMGGETRAGFEGTLTFKRSDFDMKGLAEAVGDDVTLIVSLEGIEKK